MYAEYFFSVHNIFTGKGWYANNKKRVGLDWLTKLPPTFPH
jgi:hypothetical protein